MIQTSAGRETCPVFDSVARRVGKEKDALDDFKTEVAVLETGGIPVNTALRIPACDAFRA